MVIQWARGGPTTSKFSQQRTHCMLFASRQAGSRGAVRFRIGFTTGRVTPPAASRRLALAFQASTCTFRHSGGQEERRGAPRTSVDRDSADTKGTEAALVSMRQGEMKANTPEMFWLQSATGVPGCCWAPRRRPERTAATAMRLKACRPRTNQGARVPQPGLSSS
jgi:hypothetical protein